MPKGIGPCLHVRHSFGGLNIRMFDSMFSDQVIGVVLVDAARLDQDKKCVAALGPPVTGKPDSVAKPREFLAGRVDPASNPEQIESKASEAQVRAAGDLGGEPLAVLSHSSEYLTEKVLLKLEEVCRQLQAALKRVSTNSALKQSPRVGNYLHAEDH